MKFDICDVFSQDEYDEIRKFLLEKLNHIPEEATISDVSMELHKIIEEVLYEYEIDAMIWEVDLMRWWWFNAKRYIWKFQRSNKNHWYS